jgi:AcrR family transcriptional regulator
LPESASALPAGLRERKKLRTRETIRAHAMHLFATQGYDATTVQQIIDEVEVSESTFFRYFPTKADVVLSDDFDPLIVSAFLAQPADVRPMQAMRAAFHEAFGRLTDQEVRAQTDRMHLVLAVPELRAGMLDQFAQAMGLLAGVLAERTGRSPNDMSIRTLAGAIVGAAMAVMFAMFDDPAADMSTLLDEAMGHLEDGLRL